MAIPSEVRRTIKALDKKIKELEETKRRLTEAFGGSASSMPTTPARAILRAVPAVPAAPHRAETVNEIAADTLNSNDRFLQFIAEHGPATRAEIISAGIPGGSISWLIRRNSELVRRREDGKIELAS